jgi:hypothetical protein
MCPATDRTAIASTLITRGRAAPFQHKGCVAAQHFHVASLAPARVGDVHGVCKRGDCCARVREVDFQWPKSCGGARHTSDIPLLRAEDIRPA